MGVISILGLALIIGLFDGVPGSSIVQSPIVPFLTINPQQTVVLPLSTEYLATLNVEAVLITAQKTVPRAGTLTQFYLTTTSTQNAGGSMVCTVALGATPTLTAIAVSITAGASAQQWSDTTDTAQVTAGENVVVECQNNYDGDSAGIGAVTLGLQ